MIVTEYTAAVIELVFEEPQSSCYVACLDVPLGAHRTRAVDDIVFALCPIQRHLCERSAARGLVRTVRQLGQLDGRPCRVRVGSAHSFVDSRNMERKQHPTSRVAKTFPGPSILPRRDDLSNHLATRAVD